MGKERYALAAAKTLSHYSLATEQTIAERFFKETT
jgi:hypothetical protein